MRLLLHGYGDDLGPLPIVAACDRVNADINRRLTWATIASMNSTVKRQHDRGWCRGWWRGVVFGVALSAVLGGIGVVWWQLR
jgi:hypothetical protein